MKSVFVVVCIIFINCSLVIGYPRKKVVFPSSNEDNVPCANSTVHFCDEVSEQLYPTQQIMSMLQKNPDLYSKFFKIKNRFDLPEENEQVSSNKQCATIKTSRAPKLLKNIHSELRYVINLPHHIQQYTAHLCRDKSSQCQYGSSFPPGMVSTCQQGYSKIELLIFDGDLEPDEFEIESHCICEWKPRKRRPNRKNKQGQS